MNTCGEALLCTDSLVLGSRVELLAGTRAQFVVCNGGQWSQPSLQVMMADEMRHKEARSVGAAEPPRYLDTSALVDHAVRSLMVSLHIECPELADVMPLPQAELSRDTNSSALTTAAKEASARLLSTHPQRGREAASAAYGAVEQRMQRHNALWFQALARCPKPNGSPERALHAQQHHRIEILQ
jgi:hypothetical protein